MGIRPSKKAPKMGEWVNDGDGNYSKQTCKIVPPKASGSSVKSAPPLTVIIRKENEVPREELLLRDVTQMFWELRELREEIKALRKENGVLKTKNKKLEYENDYLLLSNMRE